MRITVALGCLDFGGGVKFVEGQEVTAHLSDDEIRSLKDSGVISVIDEGEPELVKDTETETTDVLDSIVEDVVKKSGPGRKAKNK